MKTGYCFIDRNFFVINMTVNLYEASIIQCLFVYHANTNDINDKWPSSLKKVKSYQWKWMQYKTIAEELILRNVKSKILCKIAFVNLTLKMLGLYLDTLIIGHKFCNILEYWITKHCRPHYFNTVVCSVIFEHAWITIFGSFFIAMANLKCNQFRSKDTDIAS